MALRPLSSFRAAALWPLAAALPVAGIMLWTLLPRLLQESAAENLSVTLPLLSRELAADVGGEPERVQERLEQLARGGDLRLTLIAADGTVVADSARGLDQVRRMENHGRRPEVVAARERGRGESVRRSSTTGVHYVYVARPLRSVGGELFVLRLARPLTAVENLRGALLRTLGWTAALSLAAVVLVWWWLERELYRPLDRLVAGAESLARGGYEQRLEEPGAPGLADVARALNRLTEGVRRQVGVVEAERNQLQAVLAGMSDGVLVADRRGRVRLVNAAFRALFDLQDGVDGATVLEVTRQPALAQCIERILAGGAAAGDEGPFELHLASGRDLAIRASPFGDEGALVMAQDVSERVRMERTRRDFVANVSHELRTPLTAIRGYAETLRDGGVDEAATARRFADRILRQSQRLEALLADLLSLSRLESAGFRAEENRRRENLTELVEGALETIAGAAAERGLRVEAELEPAVTIEGYPEALERMVLNLLDNAVKYNQPGGWIRVRLAAAPEGILLAVEDGGIGIPAAAQTRVFERFYRVDKGRSRQEGGTGLGLALVKHAAQIHGGSIEVESEPGKGSSFRVRLPPPRRG